MPQYNYIAKNDSGQNVKGLIFAENPEQFYQEVKKKSLHLVEYSEKVETAMTKDIMAGSKIPLKQVAIFCRQMASLLKVGVSLVKAIDIMYQQTKNKQLKSSIKELYETVQKGSLMSAGLKRQVGRWPELMVSMVESGEASGSLDATIGKLADQFEADVKLKSRVVSAVTYPAILLFITIGVVILMSTVVLPQFVKMFESSGVKTLPLPTQIMLGFSDVLIGYWYYILAVLVIGISIFRTWKKTEAGHLAWDTLKIKIPVVKSITIKLAVVRFARTFATLFSSGMPMLQALTIVMKVVGNQLIANELGETCNDIRRGFSLTSSIKKVKEFPPLVNSMISIGEEAGSLDEMLQNSAEYFDEELNTAIAKMISMIEPIMIMVLAVIVCFIVISIMLPMLQIYQNIQ